MTKYYLIPNTITDKQALATGAGAVSAVIQPTSTETVNRVHVESSKKSTVWVQHSKTATGPWSSWFSTAGVVVDSTEAELYYWLEANYYARVYIENDEGHDEEVKVWWETDADPVYGKPSGVYRASGLGIADVPHSDVMAYLVRATAEVDLLTQRVWNTRTAIEDFNGDNGTIYWCRNYPIISVSALTVNGTTVTVGYLSVEKDTGRVQLDTNQAVEVGTFYSSGELFMRNTITYTYGYATVPPLIAQLTECLAGLMALSELTGGIYNQVNNFTLGSRSINSGEPYLKLQAAAERLQAQADKILTNIPKGWYVPQ